MPGVTRCLLVGAKQQHGLTLHGADPPPSDGTAASEQVPQALRGSGGRLEGAMEEGFLLPSAGAWLGLGLAPLERPCPPQGTQAMPAPRPLLSTCHVPAAAGALVAFAATCCPHHSLAMPLCCTGARQPVGHPHGMGRRWPPAATTLHSETDGNTGGRGQHGE